MRNTIWYEFVQIKFGETYLALYLDRQKIIRKWFKILTLVFSTSGVLGWTVWEYAPIISCGLIAVMQIVNLLESQIILSDTDLEKVSELRNQYIQYFNKLEKLWLDFNAVRLTDKEATDKFYGHRKIGQTIESLDNKLNIQQVKILIEKADKQTNNYFQHYHP